MRVFDVTGKASNGNEAVFIEAQKAASPLGVACLRAADLIRDYFTRGEPGAEKAPIDEASLTRLFDDVEAAIGLVADLRAGSIEDVQLKRTLQEQLRPHRLLLADLLSMVGRSIDQDLQHLLAAGAEMGTSAQSGSFWRSFSSRKPRATDPRGERSLLRA